MPWQQHVADVILEVDPDTGELAYTEFGLTVPRQSGKSTLVLAKAVHRVSATGFFGPRQRLVYTAQTRHKAREKWEEDYAGQLEASRHFAGKIKTHKGNGNEHIRFPNGSRFGIEANTEKAGHGGTIDEAYLDEAFAHPDARLEQAFRPAMITRRNKQLGVISTRGWKGREPYLLKKIEKGRAQAEMGMRAGTAYFEWSAPDDADPLDRDVWRACMPALGYTITEAAIAAELETIGLADFRRAYLNQSVSQDAAVEWSVIGKAPWDARRIAPVRPDGPVMFAVAASWPDADSAAVAVIGQSAGRITVQIHRHQPGVSWAVEELARLVDAHPNLGVVIDQGGPAGRLVAPLEAALPRGTELIKASMADAARAFGLFQTEVVGDAPRLAHFDQPELNGALASATKRPLGDGFTWARRDATDIAPLEAGTLGVWAFLSRAHLAARATSVYEERGFVEL
jgi:terminase large subunit-like protein